MAKGYNSNYQGRRGGGLGFYIDTSDAERLLKELSEKLTKARADLIMQRAMSNTGRKVKSIIRKAAQKEYAVKLNWVSRQVGSPHKTGTVGCVIPVKGVRGILARGSKGEFAITGGQRLKGRHRYRAIQAKIVKGTKSTLPATIPHQGGNPPFVARGIVFTRKYRTSSHPIVRVPGIGVPQIPINRSQEEVQEEIVGYLEQEITRQYELYLRGLQ